MKRIAFDSAAQADIRGAKRYYEEKQQGLGEDFLGRLREQFQFIVQHPLAAPLVEEDVRRKRESKFHFDIYYRVGHEDIYVIAIIHQRQHQDTWKNRI